MSKPTIYRRPIGKGELAYFVHIDGQYVSVDERIALHAQRHGHCVIRTPDDHRRAYPLKKRVGRP